jgi:hypothetical protein
MIIKEDGLTINYDISLEEMLLKIPAGPEREEAAIALDQFLGIQHIPTEGYEQSAINSSTSLEDEKVQNDN